MTTYIGAGLKRFEDPQLVKGAGSFVEDLYMPGMLHAAVLRSPHAHARINSIDVSAAREMPGVVAVATADDLEGTNPCILLPVPSHGVKMTPQAHPVLARGRARYVGEPVAVVVAENRYLARDAVDLIKVDYEPLPVVIDPKDALKDEVILHEEIGTNVVFRVDHRHGDVEEAFRQADRVVRGSYETQRLSPAPMENRGVVVVYDREADLLTMWSSTQSAHAQKAGLVHVLKRAPKTIRVIAPDVGGGFGQKTPLFPDVAAICYLAIKLQRPIKWIEDRAENMVAFQGRGMTCEAEAAVKSDGTILGFRAMIICDIGAYFFPNTPIPPAHMADRIIGPYKTPVMDVKVRGMATNKPTTGPYRGAGGPESTYFMERTMDLIASELGLDPAEVRRRNLIPSDGFPYTTAAGLVYDSGDYATVLDRTLELAGYDELRREQAQARAEGRLVGIGVTTFVKGAGGGGRLLESNARVEIGPEGHVNVYTEVSPHGQGSETTFAQIAADVLGVGPERVSVFHGDTDMLEEGAGTMASRAVIIGGTASYLALKEAREKLSRIAADLFKCSPEEVEFRDGKVYPKGASGRQVSFAEITARAFQEETLPPGMGPGLAFTSEFTLPGLACSFGAQVVVAEVDRDTGEVKLLRCIGVHDCGRIINPKLTEGQVHGGLMQGIGQAMTENVAYTPEGQPLASTFMDYGIPLAEDMPELTLESHETLSPTNPLGTKGAGEMATVGIPASVSNAVVDALSPLGIRHLDTPYTPNRVWHAIRQAGS